MVHEDLKYAPRGYVSEESKKKFTLSVGILGAVFFLVQMVAPFIAMLCMMPALFLGGGFEVRQILVNRGVFFDSKIWILTRVERLRNGPGGRAYLLSALAPEGDAKPVEFGTVPLESPWLLRSPGRLWLIGRDRVGWVEHGRLEIDPNASALGDVSQPFLLHGAPAVVENTPAGALIRTYGPHGWETAGRLGLRQEKSIRSPESDLVVVTRGDRLDLFVRIDESIYHHAGLPAENDP